jgi:hypothetical protein
VNKKTAKTTERGITFKSENNEDRVTKRKITESKNNKR